MQGSSPCVQKTGGRVEWVGITCFVFWASKGKETFLHSWGCIPLGAREAVFLGQWGGASIWGMAGLANWKNCNFRDSWLSLAQKAWGFLLRCVAGSHNDLDQQSLYWNHLSKATPCGSKEQQQQRLSRLQTVPIHPSLLFPLLSQCKMLEKVWEYLSNYREE